MSLRAVGRKLFLCAWCVLPLVGCGAGIAPLSSSLPPAASSPSVTPNAVSSGPQLGYLWSDSDHALHPVLGVPGSSQLGAAVAGSGVYSAGAASARSGFALLVEPDGTLDVVKLPAGSPQRISGVSVAAGSQIVFAPAGQSALIFAPGGTALTLLTSLNATPQVQTLTAPSAMLAATVSDTSQIAVASGSGPVAVSVIGKSTVTSVSALGGLSFLPGGDDLLVAGGTSVTVVRHSSSAPASQNFSSPLIQSPLAVAGSQDGQWAVVANGADQSVVRIDLSNASQPLKIACACQPALLAQFDGNAVFRLTALGAGPTWMVDASGVSPHTYFIPAVKQ